MITDKDRALGDLIIAEYENACGSSNADNSVYVNIARIRAESAEQARKEAAERAVLFYQRDCGGCGEKCGECSHTKQLRKEILDDSAAVSTDAEKLAIAVKALEEIKQIRKAGPAFESHFSKLQDIGRITNDALNEIHG